MELFRNIFFNTDKVIENTDVKVTYAGKLFQNGSEDVTVHYGFGENWENAQDIQMQKSELGFQADIHVQPNTKLNFCFKNAKGEWDNNCGNNYIFQIEKNPVELIVLDDEPVSLGKARKLRKSYIWSKKIKLAVYKIITYLPKVISGNYRKKSSNEN